MGNMLSNQAPWNLVADGYAEVTMKLFRVYNLAALELVKPNTTDKIIDIACGPGTLAMEAYPLVDTIHATDFSESMLGILDNTIQEKGINNITTHCCDGQQLPYGDEEFDAAFSLFGLMFFPDRNKGYKEILRVLKPGCKAVISSWLPLVESNGQKLIFDTLRHINPAVPKPGKVLDSLENPDFFQTEMEQAGFKEVKIHKVTGDMEYKGNPDEFWNEMVRGAAPITAYKNSMNQEMWQEKCQHAADYIRQQLGTTPTTLFAHAWLAEGTK